MSADVGVKVKIDLSRFPSRLIDEAAMKDIAEQLRASITQRAFFEGLDVKDATFDDYSKTARVVYFASETARRLKPRGGTPWKGRRGPRKGETVGRFYEGGYRQYKEESRKGLREASVEVDLILSGQLSRSLRVVRTTSTQARIEVRGSATAYAQGVNQKREWLGVSPRNVEDLNAVLPEIVAAAAARSTAGQQA